MRIIYHNRNELSPESLVLPATSTSPSFDLKPYVTYVPTQDALLEQSDVVSLNLPLNAKTHKSFGAKQFAKMKKGAVLVNTARGGVVDEEAMIDALESGQVRRRLPAHLRMLSLTPMGVPQLGSAGLDVFPDEPNINPKLQSNAKISLLPHMGTETEESQHKMELRVLQGNIDPALSGKGLGDPVWEQKGKL